MELLTQMDGFDQSVNVKVIMCTNRADTLDPALLRPGRLDRKIEFPQPGRREKRLIFQVLTASMNLSEEVDLEDYVSRPEKVSGAEISCIVQEAGMQAVRNNRCAPKPKPKPKRQPWPAPYPPLERDQHRARGGHAGRPQPPAHRPQPSPGPRDPGGM